MRNRLIPTVNMSNYGHSLLVIVSNKLVNSFYQLVKEIECFFIPFQINKFQVA